MGIHPQLANVDLAVYCDLAVGRVLILNSPHALTQETMVRNAFHMWRALSISPYRLLHVQSQLLGHAAVLLQDALDSVAQVEFESKT